MDAAVVPAFVAALAPLVARSLGCRGAGGAARRAGAAALRLPGRRGGAGAERAARRGHAARGGDPGMADGPGAGWNAPAAAVLDLFGHAPAAPVLAALAAGDGAARRSEFLAGGVRAEVEIGPGALRRPARGAAGGGGPSLAFARSVRRRAAARGRSRAAAQEHTTDPSARSFGTVASPQCGHSIGSRVIARITTPITASASACRRCGWRGGRSRAPTCAASSTTNR